MSTLHPLQIAPSPATGAALSPEQKRFNTLIGEIGQSRATLAAWQTQIPLYHQAHVKRIEPLIAQWRQARRAVLFVLDGLYDQPDWTKAEVETLREVIVDRLDNGAAGEVGGGSDPALKALFDRHREVVVDPDTQASQRELNERVEALVGVDLASSDDTPSDEERMERLQAELAARLADEEKREAARATARATAKAARASGHAGHKRASAAQWRRDEEARQATQSVREVYRKLASALHPDREPDGAQRDAKTVLMQRVNSAYAASDLLALLELQLEIEQVDASHLQSANARRLKHYNQVLAEQLRELKLEAERVQLQFELDFGIDAPGPLNPMKLGRLVDEAFREISALLAESKREARMLTDRAATRKWLKRMRQELRESMGDDFFDRASAGGLVLLGIPPPPSPGGRGAIPMAGF